MYGAILRPRSELVERGDADLATLFATNDGYSVMCGHATIAIGRLLVDCAAREPEGLPHIPLEAVRRRLATAVREQKSEVEVRLHVPCGLVTITVPIARSSHDSERCGYDTSRPISYLSVPSFASGIDVTVPIPPALKWPELGDRNTVTVDVSYGGTFYIIAPPTALGFSRDALVKPNLSALSLATKNLKTAFNSSEEMRTTLHHSVAADLQFLYATILVDDALGKSIHDSQGAETGICFFADQQVDRSPTGSGVQARVALAWAKGQRKLGETWTYHSLVSHAHEGEGAFTGCAVEEHDLSGTKSLIVRVSGTAKYTGSCTFVVEKGDKIGDGFWFPGVAR